MSRHKHGHKNKKKKLWLKIPLGIVGVILAIVIIYVGYVFGTYSRIEDMQELEIGGRASQEAAKLDTEYTAVSYNIGFGAYTPDFTFFMDGGTESWAFSRESVVACINGAAETAKSFDPDIVLYQEVDFDSTRSYHVNQREMLQSAFGGYASAFAVNYHSAFLMYPFTQPHGASNSGILTLSDMEITSATRRSFPIANGIKKIVDLDRCYSVSRIPTEDGRELVIYNQHMSAYGTDSEQGEAQVGMLLRDMQAEYEAGNYVICGGDFNHDFTGTSKALLNPGTDRDYSWCQPFPAELLPDGFSLCTDYAEGLVASTRDTDIPYGPDSFTVTLDGFIISDNVECTYTQVIDRGFTFSDHNPVVLKFKLKSDHSALPVVTAPTDAEAETAADEE